MDMDITKLAAETAALLAPFLPYLIEGGKIAAQKAFEKTGEKFADSTWKKAEELWGKLKPKLKDNSDAQHAIEKAARKPNDPRILGNLEAELEELFEKDKALANFVNDSIIVQGDVNNSILIDGDGNLVAANGARIQQIVNNYVAQYPSANPQRLKQQIVEYLQWAQENFGVIELRGIEQGDRQVIRLSLDKIYVPLQAEYQLDQFMDDLESEQRTAPKRDLQKSSREPSESRNQSIPLSQILKLNSRLIVTGGPGCGKTTVLQHIAWSLAKTWLENNDFAEKKLGIKSPYPLPIYVPLNLFAAHLRHFANTSAKQKTLASFISEYLIQNQASLDISPDFFANLLQEEHSVILLLDGLDEVPTENERIQVREDIENLVKGKKDLRVVVTSRSAAYRGKAMLGHGFQHVRVLPLGQEHVESLLHKAFEAQFPKAPARAKKEANALIESIQRLEADRQKRVGKDVEPLVDNPLMVRMFLIVAANNRVLPNQRADLYDKTVIAMLRPENILDEEVAEDIGRRVGGGLSVHREMLQHLAFHMHQRGREQGKEIDEDTLRNILKLVSAHAPHVDDLIALTRQRGTVLDFRNGVYRFMHLSFQEFLVARYMAENMRDIQKIAEFLEQGPIHDSWWRECILLLIGYLDLNASLQASALLLRLAHLDENMADQKHSHNVDTQIACAEISGSALLECQFQPADISLQLAKRLANLIEDKKSQNPQLRAEAGDTLAKLGDPRPGIALSAVEGHVALSLLFCEIPAGSFLMGNTKKTDPMSDDDEKPQFTYDKIKTNYFMSRYPITNAQFDLFIQDPDGYTNKKWWTKDGLKWRKDRTAPDKQGGAFDLLNHPVVNVTWYEAHAFTRWLTAHIVDCKLQVYDPAAKIIHIDDNLKSSIANRKSEIRLPTEAEWEKAAHGGKSLHYPWGDEITPNHANYSDTHLNVTSAVGAFPLGMNDYGLLDMSGNVREWCATEWQRDYDDYLKKENNKPEGAVARVLRGGAFNDYVVALRCAYRLRYYPFSMYWNNGFRVVVASFPISLLPSSGF